METCRKLDSIRAAGFPEASSGASAGVTGAAMGDPPPRPSSEPLPHFATELSEQERPGTAVSASDVLAARDTGRVSVIEGSATNGEEKNIGGQELSAASPGSQNSQADVKEKHDVDKIDGKLDIKERTFEQSVRFGGNGFDDTNVQETLGDKPGIRSTAETRIDDKADSRRQRHKKVRVSSRPVQLLLQLL